jgi:TrmH family RNA methyltransferase
MHVPPLSHENPLVRELRDLHRPEGRRTAQAVLVEGRRAIEGFLEAGWRPDLLLHPLEETPPPTWVDARPISAKAAARLTQASTPSGWFALFPLPTPPPLNPFAGGLVLAEIADPGNLGTLIRSAAAFGIAQVVILGGADPWGNKVVQASAGSLAAVAIHGLSPEVGLTPLAGAPRAALVVSGGADPATIPVIPRWLVVGSEAHGLRDEWLSQCEEHITLPMHGRVESLNAAVAGSIACYLLMQRNAR